MGDAEPWVRRMLPIVGVWPIALFVLATGWAVASSAAIRAPGVPATVVPEPAPEVREVPGVRLGSWEDDPTCIDDPRGDVQTRDADPADHDRPVGGPGDLVSACARYSGELTVEARMAEPIVLLPGGADEAALDVQVAVDDDNAAGFSVTVARLDRDRVAEVRAPWNFETPPPCVASAAWQQEVVRVVLRADCTGDPSRLALTLRLARHDPYGFTNYDDATAELVLEIDPARRTSPQMTSPQSPLALVLPGPVSTRGRAARTTPVPRG